MSPCRQTVTRRAWPIAAVSAEGLFLAVVFTTVVSVALPTIGSDLRASATDLQWIVDAYVLVVRELAGRWRSDR